MESMNICKIDQIKGLKLEYWNIASIKFIAALELSATNVYFHINIGLYNCNIQQILYIFDKQTDR